MKNTILLLAMSLLPLIALGQNKAVKQFFEQYKDQKDATHFELGPNLLQLTVSDEEEKKVIEKVNRLRILLLDDGQKAGDSAQGLLKKLRKDNFEELVSVRDEGSKVDVLIRESGKTITDILLVVRGKDGFIMLSIEGALTWEDLEKLNLDVEGGEFLEEIPKKRKDVPRA